MLKGIRMRPESVLITEEGPREGFQIEKVRFQPSARSPCKTLFITESRTGSILSTRLPTAGRAMFGRAE